MYMNNKKQYIRLTIVFFSKNIYIYIFRQNYHYLLTISLYRFLFFVFDKKNLYMFMLTERFEPRTFGSKSHHLTDKATRPI